MSKQYNLKCRICDKPPKPNKDLQEVMSTDTVTSLGYVCTRCKNGLDQFDNDPILLRRAIDFLVEGEPI